MTEYVYGMTITKRDTLKATEARSAAAARRRHEKYIEELTSYGIKVEIPENYTGRLVERDR
jgi:hypothetical protein